MSTGSIVFCREASTFGLERLLSCVKIALTANRVFFQTLPRSIYKSFMIKGSGQGMIRLTDRPSLHDQSCLP